MSGHLNYAIIAQTGEDKLSIFIYNDKMSIDDHN